ncbi:MAG: hypothetical protein E7632_12395 [Ruminococcaceae bacterium]|nr:hypothetical protein [Oscillospiraceae bacterium]
MNDTDRIDELEETLRSFWRFMLIFALILASLVGYVNAAGAIAKATETYTIPWYDSAPPPEERLLRIMAYTTEKDENGQWTQGLHYLQNGGEVCAILNDPRIEFYGDGFIELKYSDHVNRHIEFGRPNMGEIANRITGRDGYAYREDEMLAIIPANVGRNLDITGEIVDWHFTGTEREYRDQNRIYNQYMGETFDNVSVYGSSARRFVSETHLNVTLYSKWRQSQAIATATIRIRSHDRWRDDYASGDVPESAGPYGMSNTTLEIIDYWEIDDYRTE